MKDDRSGGRRCSLWPVSSHCKLPWYSRCCRELAGTLGKGNLHRDSALVRNVTATNMITLCRTCDHSVRTCDHAVSSRRVTMNCRRRLRGGVVELLNDGGRIKVRDLVALGLVLRMAWLITLPRSSWRNRQAAWTPVAGTSASQLQPSRAATLIASPACRQVCRSVRTCRLGEMLAVRLGQPPNAGSMVINRSWGSARDRRDRRPRTCSANKSSGR